MYEDELTMPFCARCREAFVASGEADDRHWACPECGAELR